MRIPISCRPLIDRVRHQPVDPDRGQHQRDAGEDTQEHHVEALPCDGAGEDLGHGALARDRHLTVNAVQLALDGHAEG